MRAEPEMAEVDGSVPCVAEEIELIARAGVARPYRGEVRIWSDAGYLTRIHLCDGRIAWVHCNRHREHLGDVLRRRANVSSWSLRRAMDHAARTGTNLGEALAALSILPLPRLREVLQEHIQSHIVAAVEVRETMRAEFVPLAHRYNTSLTFEVGDFVWDPASCAGETDRPESDAALVVERCREVVEAIDGGVSFAVVDLVEELVLAHAARSPDAQASHAEALELLLTEVFTPIRAWDHAGSDESGGALEELGLQFGGLRMVVRASDGGRRGYVLLVDERCSLGAAAAHLRLVTEQFDGAIPDED